ncbi:MAG: hypothetical protein MI806_26470 [Minwuiales bacterium]|nr:hypothetical protein [Minwuiales bacterium]
MPIDDLETSRQRLRKLVASDLTLWTAFFRSERAVFIGGGADRDAAFAWRAFGST